MGVDEGLGPPWACIKYLCIPDKIHNRQRLRGWAAGGDQLCHHLSSHHQQLAPKLGQSGMKVRVAPGQRVFIVHVLDRLLVGNVGMQEWIPMRAPTKSFKNQISHSPCFAYFPPD